VSRSGDCGGGGAALQRAFRLLECSAPLRCSPYRFTPHHFTPHHFTPHHFTPHHFTPPTPPTSPRYVHEGILRCARAVRDHLSELGLLEALLTGSPSDAAGDAGGAAAGGALPKGGGPGGGGGPRGGGSGSGSGSGSEGGGGVEWLVPGVERRDCRGWSLVITGHSLGGCEFGWGAGPREARAGGQRACLRGQQLSRCRRRPRVCFWRCEPAPLATRCRCQPCLLE
jgi:hypothetical protein